MYKGEDPVQEAVRQRARQEALVALARAIPWWLLELIAVLVVYGLALRVFYDIWQSYPYLALLWALMGTGAVAGVWRRFVHRVGRMEARLLGMRFLGRLFTALVGAAMIAAALLFYLD